MRISCATILLSASFLAGVAGFSASLAVAQQDQFLMPEQSAAKAKQIIAAMKERVKSTWYDVARRAGVSENDCDRISNAFVYPGFDLEDVQPVDGR